MSLPTRRDLPTAEMGYDGFGCLLGGLVRRCSGAAPDFEGRHPPNFFPWIAKGESRAQRPRESGTGEVTPQLCSDRRRAMPPPPTERPPPPPGPECRPSRKRSPSSASFPRCPRNGRASQADRRATRLEPAVPADEKEAPDSGSATRSTLRRFADSAQDFRCFARTATSRPHRTRIEATTLEARSGIVGVAELALAPWRDRRTCLIWLVM